MTNISQATAVSAIVVTGVQSSGKYRTFALTVYLDGQGKVLDYTTSETIQ
jgi:hypothetical protein